MFSGCGTSRRHEYTHLFYESYMQGASDSFRLTESICLLCLGMPGVSAQSCHLGQPKAVRTHI